MSFNMQKNPRPFSLPIFSSFKAYPLRFSKDIVEFWLHETRSIKGQGIRVVGLTDQ